VVHGIISTRSAEIHQLKNIPALYGFILASGVRHDQLSGLINMNRKEIAQRVRIEANELDALVKKLKFRAEHLKWLADALESESAPPAAKNLEPVPEGKFRKLINKVYGEKA
jgi:hypothetical protein